MCAGFWQCPITNKAFTNYSHVVAIKSTGNVYTYEAVNELNIKSKNFHDLITNEPFTKSEILTLQDPENDEHVALRDINNFAHLKTLRDENTELAKTESTKSTACIVSKLLNQTQYLRIPHLFSLSLNVLM